MVFAISLTSISWAIRMKASAALGVAELIIERPSQSNIQGSGVTLGASAWIHRSET
jgi:hypothetical protein